MATAGTKKWWKNSIVYQIYPRSFCDSNGDGIGDIPGIISKLHYLKDLGTDIIMLGPVFSSPCLDKGYDISDFKGIHPDLGTMEDMDKLISRAKRVGIKIVLDISINCTSDKHEWFKKALAGEEKYRNYYFFRKNGGLRKPNNWSSLYGGSVWEKTEAGDYYLHLLSKNQPELNWDNPDVYNEMVDVMKFWMDKGIAGFRLDSINIIHKDSQKNGRFCLFGKGKEHYLNTKETSKILERLNKDVWSSYKSFVVGETVLSDPDYAKCLCENSAENGRAALDTVFFFGRVDAENSHFRYMTRNHSVGNIIKMVDKGQNVIEYPINYLETGDDARYVRYFGEDKDSLYNFEKLLTGMNLSLKGIPLIFEGKSSVDSETTEDSTSLNSFISKMVEFRKNSKALSEGSYRRVASRKEVYIFTREATEERLYVYCNFSDNSTPVEFYGDRIIFSSYGIEESDGNVLQPFEFRIVASNI